VEEGLKAILHYDSRPVKERLWKSIWSRQKLRNRDSDENNYNNIISSNDD